MVQHLSVSSRDAMLVHCTAGKDRTGVLVMLILGLCGVDDEIIAREYDLSSIGHYEPRVEEIANNVGVTVEKMRAALGTSYDGMILTMKILREKYGSFEGYARTACGLSMEEINTLRHLLIVPIKFEERQLYRPRM
ncbi:hypothetical protein K501DRAFT_289460 [Backusella circina FSU 941]|nr:hypothetical protein K501DRAFT_289460 [Backusella circina FSU 941]